MFDSSKPYGMDNCDCELTCLAESVAASVVGCTLEDVHEVLTAYQGTLRQQVPARGTYGFDPAIVILLIETLLPIFMEMIEDCQERTPERQAASVMNMGFLEKLYTERKLWKACREEGSLSRRDARRAARETMDKVGTLDREYLVAMATRAQTVSA